MAFARPSRNLSLPLSSSSVSITKVHMSCIPEIPTSLQSCEYATLFHIFTPVHLLVLPLEQPTFLLLPPSDELLLILKESSHLYCLHEPPKQVPTPFYHANPLPVIYYVIAFIILHCNNTGLSTFFSSVCTFLPSKICVSFNEVA